MFIHWYLLNLCGIRQLVWPNPKKKKRKTWYTRADTNTHWHSYSHPESEMFCWLMPIGWSQLAFTRAHLLCTAAVAVGGFGPTKRPKCLAEIQNGPGKATQSDETIKRIKHGCCSTKERKIAAASEQFNMEHAGLSPLATVLFVVFASCDDAISWHTISRNFLHTHAQNTEPNGTEIWIWNGQKLRVFRWRRGRKWHKHTQMTKYEFCTHG